MNDNGVQSVQVLERENIRIPLEYITIPASNKHTATVIWLHGLGDSGNGMAPLVEEMSSLPALGHIKWIAPHARSMAVTGNGGAIMPSWFDCYSFDIPNRQEDEEGLYKAVAQINDIITNEEKSGVPSDRIILGGLSQGSAVSVLLGLTTQRPLAGMFVLSGSASRVVRPLIPALEQIASPLARSLPIFWGHGRVDQQVEYQFSIKAAETLAGDLGIPFNGSFERLTSEELLSQSATPGLRFLTYPWLGHSINDTEMGELASWFSRYLPAL